MKNRLLEKHDVLLKFQQFNLSGNVEVVRTLIEYGAGINSKYNEISPLQYAAFYGKNVYYLFYSSVVTVNFDKEFCFNFICDLLLNNLLKYRQF